MKYLSKETVVTAWKNLKDAEVPPRLAGLLQIFKSSDLTKGDYIKPFEDFTYDLSKIKVSLDEIFNFSNTLPATSASEKNHAVVAKDWIESVKKLYIPNHPVNILDIAVVLFWPYELNDDCDAFALISRFQKEYCVSEETINTLFVNNAYDLTFVNTKIDRAALKTALCTVIGQTEDITKNTLTFDDALKSHASALKGSPFYQSIYANDKLNEILIITKDNTSEKYNISSILTAKTARPKSELRNRIIYGAPGTGKSRLLEEQAVAFGEKIRRVTFYSDYSNAQFIGSFRPRPLYLETTDTVFETIVAVTGETGVKRRPVLDYKVTPGPLLLSLRDAICDSENDHLLIIEEINRGNTASIFGDIFQLLDRKDNVSIYAINLSKEISLWLEEELSHTTTAIDGNIVRKNGETLDIRLPKNLYIWATMNNADQGVMPLDTAFKRRWSFEYVSLDEGKEYIENWEVALLGRKVSWNKLRSEINNFLMKPSREGRVQIPEDKLLGPFFIKVEECEDKYILRDKVLLYLREDVVRHSPKTVFNNKKLHFSSLYEEYKYITDHINLATDSQEKFLADLMEIFHEDLAKQLAEKLYKATIVPVVTLTENNVPTEAIAEIGENVETPNELPT